MVIICFTCFLSILNNSPESSEHLEVDAFEYMFWSIELNEEHDEDPVIRKLLELAVTYLVIL